MLSIYNRRKIDAGKWRVVFLRSGQIHQTTRIGQGVNVAPRTS